MNSSNYESITNERQTRKTNQKNLEYIMSDLQLHIDLDAEPIFVYALWIDPPQQGMITEAFAKINPRIDGSYELWDGVVRGKFILLDAPKKIIQTWRTSEFSPQQPSTKLTLDFKPHRLGTRLLITHENIPNAFLSQFEFAWKEFYFPRLKLHFQKKIH